MATTGEGKVTALTDIGLRHQGEVVTTLTGHHVRHRHRPGTSATNARLLGVATMIVHLQQSMSLGDLLTWTYEKEGRMSIGRTSKLITMNQPTKVRKPTVPLKRSTKGGSNISGSGALQVRANVIKRQAHRLDKERQK